MDYDKIRKTALAKSALPEGWGRSVVGGREIITKPTVKAEANNISSSQEHVVLGDKNSSYSPMASNEGRLSDNDFRDMQDQELNMKEGRMRVAVGKDGKEFFVEKDLSNPNSLYVDPETGDSFFQDIKEQAQAEEEFIQLLKNGSGR